MFRVWMTVMRATGLEVNKSGTYSTKIIIPSLHLFFRSIISPSPSSFILMGVDRTFTPLQWDLTPKADGEMLG